VLCSGSPRRKQLLHELGLDFSVKTMDIDENFPPHLEREQVALFLADKKAEAFRFSFEAGTIYITSDTIVCLEHEVLNKPVDEEDAYSMLRKLSGKTHQVFTGVCLSRIEKKLLFYVKSDVSFRQLQEEEIKFYIRNYQPFDKAGSYGAQECLPDGMNPCSEKEKKFLKSVGQPDLFERTMSKEMKHMPVIEKIEGSYFNVMGLPIVELYEEIQKW
jgi:septum formation protein